KAALRTSPSLAKLAILFSFARPIQRNDSRADIAVKRRVRPIAHPRHQPVLEWIDVAILDMAGIVGFIADQVFPESPLPDATFVTCEANIAAAFLLWQQPCKAAFDEPPAGREVSVTWGQRPD